MPCIFCKIVSKEIPAHIVYENDDAIAFLDINPRAPGHTMVMPKVHAETILDLPDNKVGPVFKALKDTAQEIKKALSPDGFTIGINHGKYSGQAVGHLHIHIIPRYKGDEGTSIHGVVNNLPKESVEKIKNKILGS